jgi:hypothetical protein
MDDRGFDASRLADLATTEEDQRETAIYETEGLPCQANNYMRVSKDVQCAVRTDHDVPRVLVRECRAGHVPVASVPILSYVRSCALEIDRLQVEMGSLERIVCYGAGSSVASVDSSALVVLYTAPRHPISTALSIWRTLRYRGLLATCNASS